MQVDGSDDDGLEEDGFPDDDSDDEVVQVEQDASRPTLLFPHTSEP